MFLVLLRELGQVNVNIIIVVVIRQAIERGDRSPV